MRRYKVSFQIIKGILCCYLDFGCIKMKIENLFLSINLKYKTKLLKTICFPNFRSLLFCDPFSPSTPVHLDLYLYKMSSTKPLLYHP